MATLGWEPQPASFCVISWIVRLSERPNAESVGRSTRTGAPVRAARTAW